MEVWEEWVFKALLVDVWLTHCFSLWRSPCLENVCSSPNLLDGRVLSKAIASSTTLKEGPDLNWKVKSGPEGDRVFKFTSLPLLALGRPFGCWWGWLDPRFHSDLTIFFFFVTIIQSPKLGLDWSFSFVGAVYCTPCFSEGSLCVVFSIGLTRKPQFSCLCSSLPQQKQKDEMPSYITFCFKRPTLTTLTSGLERSICTHSHAKLALKPEAVYKNQFSVLVQWLSQLL